MRSTHHGASGLQRFQRVVPAMRYQATANECHWRKSVEVDQYAQHIDHDDLKLVRVRASHPPFTLAQKLRIQYNAHAGLFTQQDQPGSPLRVTRHQP